MNIWWPKFTNIHVSRLEISERWFRSEQPLCWKDVTSSLHFLCWFPVEGTVIFKILACLFSHPLICRSELLLCPLWSWQFVSATLQMWTKCLSQCRNVLVQETKLGRQLVHIARKEFTSGVHRRTTDSSPQTQHIFHLISHNIHPTAYP